MNRYRWSDLSKIKDRISEVIALATVIDWNPTREQLPTDKDARRIALTISEYESYFRYEDLYRCILTLIVYFKVKSYLDSSFQWAEKLIEATKKYLGADSIDIALYENVARIYFDNGFYAKVESLQVQVLEEKKRVFGEDHIQVAWSMEDLARTYEQ
jgi:hypothetical protein